MLFSFFQANNSYSSGNYNRSISGYYGIIDNGYFLPNNIKSKIYHNIGNSYYKNWYNDKNDISNIKKSINSYEKSLDINYDEYTEFNYFFVKDILEKIEENKIDQKNDNDDNQDNGSKSGSGQTDNGKKTNKNTNNSKNNNQNKFSKQDQEYIDQYIKSLEDNQEYYNKYFNKKYNQNQDILDIFKNESFFNEGFDNVEKDW